MISDNYVTGDNIYLRELQNFFFEVLGMMSITHYGAIGDGRRDNYGPLQVAIDDANRRGLSFLYVPYGKFIYTGELQNLIDPDTGKQRIIFMGNPHAHIVNIRTGEEIEIHQFGWCEGHEGDVGVIDAGDIELVDGTDISLNKDKLYRVHSLKINGVTDGEFNNAIIAVSSITQPNATKTIVTLLSSHNAIKDVNGWLYRAYLYTNDEWVLSSYNRYATTEIDENATNYELPTAKAVKDYVNSYIPSTSSTITAYLPSDFSSTGATIEDIPLAEKTKIGSGLTVNNDGEIEIGSGITKVLVSGSIRSNVQTIMIRKGGSSEAIINNPGGDALTVGLTPFLLSVSSGDKIGLRIMNGTGGTVYGASSYLYTYLTITTVE